MAAQGITVQLPDKRYVTVPTNDPQLAAKAARRFLARESLAKNAPNTFADKQNAFDQFTNRAAAGATFGLSDLVPAATEALVTGAKNLVTPGPASYTAGDAYAVQRQLDKDRADAFAKAHPVAALSGGLLGGLGAPGAKQIGGFVAKGIGEEAAAKAPGFLRGLLSSEAVPTAALRSVVPGAATGGVMGATEAAPGQEVSGAKKGAILGGLVAPAVTVAAPAVAGAVKPVWNTGKTLLRGAGNLTGLRTVDPAVSGEAELIKALRADGATQKQMLDARAGWRKNGVSNPSLVDLATKLPSGGPNTLRLLTGAALKGGGRGVAAQHAEDVATALPENAQDLLGRLQPGGKTARQAESQITGEKRAQAAQLYPEAHQTPVNQYMTPDARTALADDHGVAAINQAIDAATADRDYESAARLKALLPNAPKPQAPPPPAPPPAAAGPAPEPMNMPPPFTPPTPRTQDVIRAEEDAAVLSNAKRDVATYGQPRKNSLFPRIWAEGGVNLDSGGADLKPLAEGLRLMPGMVHKGGANIEDMAERMADQGMFGWPRPADPTPHFAAAFEREALGKPVYHPDTYGSDWEQRAQGLDQELSDAGALATDRNSVKAAKLAEFRNADTVEQRAVADEADANDPAGLEFDRLARTPVRGPAPPPPAPPPAPPPETPILAGDLDRIQQAMGQRGANLQGVAGQRDVARGLFKRQTDLNSVLENVPELTPARANYRANIARQNALELGQAGLRTGSDEYGAQLAEHTGMATAPDNAYPISADDIRNAAGTGYAQAAREAIETPPAGFTSPLSKLARSPRQILNQDATFGSADAANFREGLGNELLRARNAKMIDPTTNSASAVRLDALANLEVPKISLHGLVMSGLNKVYQGAALTDAERTAIVKTGLGSADASGLMTKLDPITHPLIRAWYKAGQASPAGVSGSIQLQPSDQTGP
jgi:hypothetical protein